MSKAVEIGLLHPILLLHLSRRQPAAPSVQSRQLREPTHRTLEANTIGCLRLTYSISQGELRAIAAGRAKYMHGIGIAQCCRVSSASSPAIAAILDTRGMESYQNVMAPKMVKSTFSLDIETARALEVLAGRWKVSKSEAVRRAVGAMAEKESPCARKKLEALRQLQASVKARGIDVEAWAREARAERRASSIKRMSVFDDRS